MLTCALVAAAPAPKSPPSLTLKNDSGSGVKLGSLKNKREVLVLIFGASTCPVTSLYWERFKGLWNNFHEKDVAIYLVGGNSDDSMEALLKPIKDHDMEIPVMWDDGHAVAKAFGLEHTPEAVVLGKNWEVLYRGRIDDAWRDETAVKERYLDSAINAALKEKKSSDHLDDSFLGSHMR